MTTLNVAELNFESIKGNLRTWMQNHSDFTDYDFEASGLSFLLDVMAYNTHYNAVLANFSMNEAFMDTCLKRSSAISHAKAVGYHPRGYHSARATLNIEITAVQGTPEPQFLLPRGTKFLSQIDNTYYPFVTIADHVAANNGDGSYTFTGIEVAEGTMYSYSYVISDTDHTIKYLIPNAKPDISTIVMRVYESTTSQANPTYYYHSTTLLDVQENDPAFFTQEAENEQIEFYFGNGVSTGMLPAVGSVVQIEYVASKGAAGNGCKNFSSVGEIASGNMTAQMVNIDVTTTATAAGGIDSESIAEIKHNASQHFTVQNRAVTASDYKSIISEGFANIESIKVWGGEDNIPIQYNTVYVCIKPAVHNYLTEVEKQQIRDLVAAKSVMNMRVVFVEPEYLNIVVTSSVYYAPTALAKNTSLISQVQSAIITYSDNDLEAFNMPLKYSKFVAMIDHVNTAINNNNTNLQLYKILPVELYKQRLYNIAFSNAILKADGSVTSDIFQISTGKFVQLRNMGDKMVIGHYESNNNLWILDGTAGTIDYATGLIALSPLNIVAYEGSQINIYMKPAGNDLYSAQNNVLRILPQDITVNIYAEV